MPEPDWRAFAREHARAIYTQRLQSQGFVHSETLRPWPLKFGTKEQFKNNPDWHFATWHEPFDLVPEHNWGALLVRTKEAVGVDIDIDCKPLSGRWTAELERQAARLSESVIRAMATLGVDCRHRYGRASQKGWGHVYLTVAGSTKADIAALASLHMKRPLILGPLKFRIEVRIAPEVASKRVPITLPGSVYPSRVHDGFDPIRWEQSPPITDEAPSFPRLVPEPFGRLRKGLYAGLLAVILEGQWVEGARHETALLAAGVLAREAFAEAPIIEEPDVEAIFAYLLDAFGDDEAKDRVEALRASLDGASRGRPVTGYTKLGEAVGAEAKAALLRMRGGSDPDTFSALLEQYAWVARAGGRENVYLNLTFGGEGAVICDRSAITAFFGTHPHFPAVAAGRRRIPLIELALASSHQQRYHAGVNLPGIPFRTLLYKNSAGYRAATEEEIGDPNAPVLINYGVGFHTPVPEEPDAAAWERWWRLWQRHLRPLTRGDPICAAKLEKAIAWAIQHPLEKVPLGLCLTGGGGIGKSVLFQSILPTIIGHHLISVTNVLALEGQFRLSGLEGVKFYVIEEANLGTTAIGIKEVLKDLMKNSSMRINRKYGAEGDVENFAIPVFLTNEESPGLHIQGRPERSLAVIQGESRENLGLSLGEWQARINRIADNVKEFIEALKDPALREAAMYYFAHHIEVDRRDFEDNSDVSAGVNPRDEASPLDEAIYTLIELNEMHPRQPVPLTAPFRAETLRAHIEIIMASQGRRLKPASHAVTKRLRALLGEDVIDEHFFKHEGKACRVLFFTIRYGDMLKRIETNTGITLTPAYELTQDDFGKNKPPAADICLTAYAFRADKPFASNGTF